MKNLIEKIIKLKNPTAAGLDPLLSYIPDYILTKAEKEYGKNFKAAAAAITEFNYGLIDALCDIVPAVKPQSAYYEMYGVDGIAAYYNTIIYAKEKGMYVIADGKRNDIGSTSDAYASAYLGQTDLFGVQGRAFIPDSLTVNPYLGSDGILPFVKRCEEYGKTIFVLVKTSNPSSGEIQDLISGGEAVYLKVAKLVNEWGRSTVREYGYSSVGAVVGATYPNESKKLREIMPDTVFLVPGYGAQGGKAADIAHLFDKDGLGAVVNSSRAIMAAYKKANAPGEAFADCARNEALKMRDDLTRI
jgi:orotidine-5'-phosphate decarboxylase